MQSRPSLLCKCVTKDRCVTLVGCSNQKLNGSGVIRFEPVVEVYNLSSPSFDWFLRKSRKSWFIPGYLRSNLFAGFFTCYILGTEGPTTSSHGIPRSVVGPAFPYGEAFVTAIDMVCWYMCVNSLAYSREAQGLSATSELEGRRGVRVRLHTVWHFPLAHRAIRMNHRLLSNQGDDQDTDKGGCYRHSTRLSRRVRILTSSLVGGHTLHSIPRLAPSDSGSMDSGLTQESEAWQILRG